MANGQGFAQDVGFIDGLTKHALLQLFEGEKVALVLDDYCPPEACDAIADRIVSHARVGGYVVAKEIHRFGLSFYDTAKDRALMERYFADAVATMHDLRDASAPYCPLDRLRCTLDEVWPGGATVAELGGRKMTAGAARVFRSNVGALPHVDSLGFDADRVPDAPVFLTQVSANVHLCKPGKGGELELWHKRILTEEEQSAYRLPSSTYGLDRDRLGHPAARIHPRQGQLILFDSTRCHAVCPSDGWTRVTLALFIGYSGVGKPLRVWN
jgi:hypothetical protein